MKTTFASCLDRHFVQISRRFFSNRWLLGVLLLVLSAPWVCWADNAEEVCTKAVAALRRQNYDLAIVHSSVGRLLTTAKQFALSHRTRRPTPTGVWFIPAKATMIKVLRIAARPVRLDPNSAHALNNYAWLLAVCPDAKLRNGAKALELAKKACELNGWKHAHFLGTLAAANAEVGNFKEAVKWQKKCLESDLPKSEQDEARQHLRLYEQKKPYHDKKR